MSVWRASQWRWTIAGAVLLLSAPMRGAALAQVDLSGTWSPRYHEDQPERIPGPELGDYLGLPITDGARLFAESWDPSRLTLVEEQCRVHVASYIYRGPLQLRIWEEKDPQTQEVLAIKHYTSTYEQTRTIYMDQRPHPPDYAAHTWQGFSTGRWEGDVLVVTTTHLKQGWLRRNGLPESDQAKLTEHFIRHGDHLTRVSMIEDPISLTEPLVKSDNFVINPRQLQQNAWLWHCEAVEEVADRPKGVIPHYLPGQNPFLKEFRDRFGIPEDATRGGAETMYPEFMLKLKALTKPKP
jgi:hypothetical protein